MPRLSKRFCHSRVIHNFSLSFPRMRESTFFTTKAQRTRRYTIFLCHSREGGNPLFYHKGTKDTKIIVSLSVVCGALRLE